jgi:hypothetical protein
MPIRTAGWLLTRALTSELRDPSATSATSLMRTKLPSGSARTTIRSNSSGVLSRPWVIRLSCSDGSSVIGCAPTRPIAACTFWARRAATTSAGVRRNWVRRETSRMMRMA